MHGPITPQIFNSLEHYSSIVTLASRVNACVWTCVLCAYLDLKGAIESHLKVLTVRILCEYLLPCLFEQ